MASNPLPHLDYPFSYQDFLLNHLLPNTPCIFTARLGSSWPCFSTFLLPRDSSLPSSSRISSSYLLDLQGSSPVSVHRPSTALERTEGETSTICEERSLQEVLDLWEEGQEEGRGLYIKDWHLPLQVERAGGEPFYDTPEVFKDDWLNGWYRSLGKQDDFRFVYLGAPSTTTHLHRDVYSSNSFSTNLLGRKKWTLFPPSHSHLLRRFPRLPRSQLVSDVRDVDSLVFKGWEEAEREKVVVTQEEGETIFVPGGWYHQVENLPSLLSANQPVLSLNHNWLNSTSLLRVYQTLVDDISACEESISDIKDILLLQHQRTLHQTQAEERGDERERGKVESWEIEWVHEVQELVKRDSGWGWEEFWECLKWGVENSLDPPMMDTQPPLSYIGQQVRVVLDSYKGRRDASVLEVTSSSVGEAVERVREVLRDQRFSLD